MIYYYIESHTAKDELSVVNQDNITSNLTNVILDALALRQQVKEYDACI